MSVVCIVLYCHIPLDLHALTNVHRQVLMKGDDSDKKLVDDAMNKMVRREGGSGRVCVGLDSDRHLGEVNHACISQ
jgi:hypothetical protein